VIRVLNIKALITAWCALTRFSCFAEKRCSSQNQSQDMAERKNLLLDK